MQDNLIELITRHLRQEATEQEQDSLLRWLEESEENRRFYTLFSANYSLHEKLSSPSLERETESMVARLNARIDASSSPARRRMSFKPFAWAFAFAAVLAVAFVVFRGIPGGKQPEPAPMEFVANNGDGTMPLVLDDGSHVYLRPGASMSYNVSTLKGKREVSLTGDAYFDVARDEERPMTVHTSSIGVRVLGTAFSVSSDNESSQVVLERGSVRILSPEGTNMVTLSPNQKAVFKNFTGDIRVEPVYATAFVTGKYNLVAMSDATVSQIISDLSKRFGVRISCSGEDDDKRYNLAFLQSDSLEDVLSMVEYLTGAQCVIANK